MIIWMKAALGDAQDVGENAGRGDGGSGAGARTVSGTAS